jgi:flagellar hook assembly protein FlgD
MLVNVPTNGNVTVRIFDTFGKLIATVFDGAAVAGQLSVNWNGLDASGNRVAPGAYMVRVDGAAVAAQPISVVR